MSKLIRCVNLKTNKVRFFPDTICLNSWWQKNTAFYPQDIEATIINQSETVSVKTENESGQIGDTDSVSANKPKRKYTKRKNHDAY